MTPQEAVVLTRYVKALCPQQRFDEYTPDAWWDVLGDYDLDTAKRAVASVASQQPFVAAAEVVEAIRKARSDRAVSLNPGGGKGLPPEIPDADPDDVPAYLRAIRSQRHRALEGEQLRPRPMKALLAGVGQHVPGDEDVSSVRRPGPLGAHCPTCNAVMGKSCVTAWGKKPRAPHISRVEARRSA